MSNSKPDWSQKCWREMLVYQRKSMWREDTLDKLAAWMGLKPGLTVVDVGCGLGYLGYTYWKYYGKGGRYIGVDAAPKLLADAREAARDWAEGGKAEFLEGDAYALPLEDNSADIAMCQALLMHLERPADALSEMARVVKPGGLVIGSEPDNLSAVMAVPFWSLPEFEIDDFLLTRKVYYLAAKGRVKLGRGDMEIGRKVPHLMTQLGLKEIDIRQNDRIHLLEPPYESAMQRDALEKIKKQHLDDDRRRIMSDRQREEFVAGGGTHAEYDRMEALGDRMRAIFREQLENGAYYACAAGGLFVIKGRKAD